MTIKIQLLNTRNLSLFIFVFFIFCFLFFVLSAPLAQAIENQATTPSEALPNPLGTTDIPTLIGHIIKALLGVTGSIALLMFIYGGILWLISGGNEKRVEQGKSVLTWATIGLGIIFTSYILVNFVIKSLTSS